MVLYSLKAVVVSGMWVEILQVELPVAAEVVELTED